MITRLVQGESLLYVESKLTKVLKDTYQLKIQFISTDCCGQVSLTHYRDSCEVISKDYGATED